MEESKKKKKVISTSTETSSTDKFDYTGSYQSKSKSDQLLYGREFYIWMLAGLGLIVLGMMLMSGGQMPDDNTWDPDLIYSFRRTTLAPLVIIAGLIVEVYAIFKK